MATNIRRFAKPSLPEAARVVAKGGLIVFPTDTVYGLGCDPANEEALNKLFLAKKREGKPIPVLCDSLASALQLVSLDGRALRIANDYWPGALTIVAPMKGMLPKLIHQDSGTVGVRVPGSDLCLELVRLCGGLLTGTSANRSGAPACRTAGDALAQLGSAVNLFLDGGKLEGKESTVIRVTERGIEVLRQGAVRVKEKG
ncbi:MAG: threonylcarbamoyl-AMP synthase [Nitrososphaerales archaeon]|nr:threonylcarbamoyl-AMP synthase [Nitrososphaerales archaeon]